MMRAILLCLLGIQWVVADDLIVQELQNFPSPFLKNHGGGLLEVMKTHFSISLHYLLDSKFYGSQFSERPGMAKLLSEESNRHWEEGMNVLKKYLQIGGTTTGDFRNRTKITLPARNKLVNPDDLLHVNYKNSLKSVMEDSRDLIKKFTNLNHHATSVQHGDADVAHFMQEKAGKESTVARKMAGYYTTLTGMPLGMALDMLDKNM